MATYKIAPGAVDELRQKRKDIIRQMGMHLITIDQARALHTAAVKEMMKHVFVDDGGSAFPIVCNGCGEINVVASDVLSYNCRCSPDVTRYTFQSRQLDIPIGTSNLKDYLAANKGRQTLTFIRE